MYRWTDGNPYMFSHWNDSKPSQQPNEECVVSLNGMWMDVPCIKEYPYLCEINLGTCLHLLLFLDYYIFSMK